MTITYEVPTFDYSKGTFTRTRYNATTKQIERTPAPLVSPHVSDSDWDNVGFTITADKATRVSTGSTGNRLRAIKTSLSLTGPVRFRCMAQGTAIDPPDTGTDIYIEVRLLNGADVDTFELSFPAGTWGPQQFELVSQRDLVTEIQVRIHCNTKAGTLTVWDLELTADEQAPAAPYGIWVSEPLDVAAARNIEPVSGTLKLNRLAFMYQEPVDVRDLDNIERAADVLASEYIVVNRPSLLNSRSLQVIDLLRSRGTKVYGYIDATLAQATIEGYVDEIFNNGDYHGVFWDNATYGFGVTRQKMNDLMDYVHAKSGTFAAIGNGDVTLVDSEVHPTGNPSGLPSHYGSRDHILFESFHTRSDDTYSGQTEQGFAERLYGHWVKARDLATALGTKCMALSYAFSSHTLATGQTDRLRAYLLAALLGLDAWAHESAVHGQWGPDLPDVKLGNAYVGDFERVAPDRLERRTDTAVIWYEFSDSPLSRSAGVYSLEIPVALVELPKRRTFTNAERLVKAVLAGDTRDTMTVVTGTEIAERFVGVKVETQIEE